MRRDGQGQTISECGVRIADSVQFRNANFDQGTPQDSLNRNSKMRAIELPVRNAKSAIRNPQLKNPRNVSCAGLDFAGS